MALKKIAEFLLKPENDPLTQYDFILTYASASTNEEWAKKIATEMQKRNMQMPNGVYLFCSDTETIDSIKEIFNPSQQTIAAGQESEKRARPISNRSPSPIKGMTF